jgi:acetolactate synthase-1/2/3 large subunit
MSDKNLLTKADQIAEFLVKKKVPAVFELSGGMIVFLTDAIYKLGKTKIIGVRHEQSAGFAAESATRLTRIPNVAMATSGPGATNLITSIASSYFDSVPTIFITGQVNQLEIKKLKEQRQHGFQELDIVSMVKNITKFSHLVTSEDDLNFVLEKAWNIAIEGRPGPVLIDIPIDVQQESIKNIGVMIKNESQYSKLSSLNKEINDLVSLIHQSEKPLILAGGGIQTSNSSIMFNNLVEKWKIPVIHSLMGVDVLDSNSDYRVGLIGSYGNRWANKAFAESDLVLSLGSRLDVRQIGSSHNNFLGNKTVIRVDVDRGEINSEIKSDLSIISDLNHFLSKALDIEIEKDFDGWHSEITKWRIENPQSREQLLNKSINPNLLISELSNSIKSVNAYLVDVGQHQMWAAQSIQLENGTRFITSGGLGAMGFAIPSAIGCAITSRQRNIAIIGDGCAQLTINELQTIKENNLPITILIFNNNQHGMVAQFQESNTPGRFALTRELYSTPNFKSVAKAYGIRAIKISKASQIRKLIRIVKKNKNKPMVIEIKISQEAKALPKNNW